MITTTPPNLPRENRVYECGFEGARSIRTEGQIKADFLFSFISSISYGTILLVKTIDEKVYDCLIRL